MDTAQRPFSWTWVLASLVAFIGAEILIGGLVGEWLLSRVVSINTSFLLQGLVNLLGFILGGFLIGVLSPGRRIVEPAIAGFLTMLLTSLVAVFVPFRWMGYTGGGVLLAGACAAALGAGGAFMGEKLMGNAGPLSSGRTNRKLR